MTAIAPGSAAARRPHLLHAAVCCSTNVVEQQHLATWAAAWEQAAAVDGAQCGHTLCSNNTNTPQLRSGIQPINCKLDPKRASEPLLLVRLLLVLQHLSFYGSTSSLTAQAACKRNLAACVRTCERGCSCPKPGTLPSGARLSSLIAESG